MRNRWRQWAAFAAALLLLDVSLSFDSLWPTPAISWHGHLSVELAVCILALLVASRRFGQPSRRTLGWLSGFWVLLILGRYADVTAPALYGRDINLYWDLRYIPDVAAMIRAAAPLWLVVVAGLSAALVLVLLYALARWALGRIGDAMADPHERRLLGLLATSLLILFVGRVASSLPDDHFLARIFAKPIIQTYARQARIVVRAFAARSGSEVVPPSPPIESDLSLVTGADVLLIFIESYGAVGYDRPEFARLLAPSRAAFETTIRATNRDVVSAYAESPTFGGSSWLAHLSLMSGIEVRDPDAYALLMSQKRQTIVNAFARQGFRTVALMPGLKKNWPEGAFYGFDDIYDARRLDYRGPWFGWFGIPDEFTIARLDAVEVNRRSRAPLFVFFPTLSTHFPFGPTPPYQPDWERMLTEDPYESEPLYRALADEPDWKDFGPSYVTAVSYAYQSLGGYLRLRADRDLVMILIGDHQPPAAVSGEGAPWDVPVHVIAGRPQVLERLTMHGFRAGLTPSRPAIGRMHTLMPVLLEAFGSPRGLGQ